MQRASLFYSLLNNAWQLGGSTHTETSSDLRGPRCSLGAWRGWSYINTCAYRMLECPLTLFRCRQVHMDMLPMTPSHLSSSLTEQARAGVFHDSGCWDSFLLVSFDRLTRVVAYSAGGWLLSHGVAERAGSKVLREVQAWLLAIPTQPLSGVFLLLRILAQALGLFISLGFLVNASGLLIW